MKIRDKVLLMRLIKDCVETKFTLFERGPLVLNTQTLQERFDKFESKQRALQVQNELGRIQ
jgi:hypothetical protein